MKKVYNFIVETAGERLDRYISKHSDFNRSTVKKMFKKGNILVNEQLVKASYQVDIGDEITFVYEEDELVLKPQKIDFEIVYEDEYLIIINKPLGLVVHPGAGNRDQTLVNGLLYYFDELSDVDETRPGIVHRIDKHTTGLLIVAKNNHVHMLLSEMIKAKTIKREYLALVHGNIKNNYGTIDAPIGRDKINRQKMVVTDINSKHAVTHFEVLKRVLDFTLIKLQLETGRTHQIRVHMRYINYPIVGDPLYGQKQTIGEVQLLHSFMLTLKHPITNELICVQAPLPKHFMEVLDIIGMEFSL